MKKGQNVLRSRLRTSLAAAAIAGCTLLAAACGNSSTTPAASSGSADAKTVQVDVGTMKVKVKGPLRIAVALPGTNNSYLQSQIKQVKEDVSKIPGASVTVFDGKFDPTTQFNVLQNIVQSGKYNAILVPSLDSNLNCNIATKDAPERGIVVVAMTTALCGRTVKEGDELWAPGSLSYVGGVDTIGYWTKYLEYVIEQNPGPQKVILLKGPENIGITINLQAALKKVRAEHPEFKIVAQANTDYSIPQGNKKAAEMIQAHPDATIIFAAYVTLTQGAIQAVEAAGKTGKFKIYDKGSSAYSLQKIEAGVIEASAPEYPKTTISSAVKLLQDAFAGKPVSRFLKNGGASTPADADPATGFFLVTKENASTFKSES